MKNHFIFLLILSINISSIFLLKNNFLCQDVKEGLQKYDEVFSKLDFRQISTGKIFYIEKDEVVFLETQGIKQKKYWFNKKYWSNKDSKEHKKMEPYKDDETIIFDKREKRPSNAQVYYFENITSNTIINSKNSTLKFIVKTEDNFSNPQELFAICRLHVRKGKKLFNKKPRRCIYKHGMLELKNYGPYPNFVNSVFENIEYIPFNAVKYLKNACLLTINTSNLGPGEYCIQNAQSMEYQLFTIK